MFSFRFLGLFVFAFLGVQCIEKEGLHWLHVLPFYRLIPKSISLIFQHKIQHTILHDDDKVKKKSLLKEAWHGIMVTYFEIKPNWALFLLLGGITRLSYCFSILLLLFKNVLFLMLQIKAS